jgi:predicted DNA-binding transcriptional regulator AlpA
MSTEIKKQNIYSLLENIASELRFSNSDDRLWGAEDIGRYMGLAKKTVQSRVLIINTFPRAVRMPSDTGLGGKRWVPSEVKQWVLRHRH